jgi:hypothetical protein
MDRPTKTCVTCGRTFAWRKRWARCWDEVRHCSDRCRRDRIDPVDRALEDAIRSLLAARARSATICPSEAARIVGGEREEAWRPLMEPARRAARRLVDRGVAEITQRGVVVDPSTARGPIRVRAAITSPVSEIGAPRRSGRT